MKIHFYVRCAFSSKRVESLCCQ